MTQQEGDENSYRARGKRAVSHYIITRQRSDILSLRARRAGSKSCRQKSLTASVMIIVIHKTPNYESLESVIRRELQIGILLCTRNVIISLWFVLCCGALEWSLLVTATSESPRAICARRNYFLKPATGTPRPYWDSIHRPSFSLQDCWGETMQWADFSSFFFKDMQNYENYH